MTAQTRIRSLHWMLGAVLAVAPTSALAAQEDLSQRPVEAAPDRSEAPLAMATADPGPTEVALAIPDVDPDPSEAAEGQTDPGPKTISGMSILGNQEAPTSLVIVPWKSSEIGDAVGISTMLDDSRQPVDMDVFMRALSYYEIRSENRP